MTNDMMVFDEIESLSDEIRLSYIKEIYELRLENAELKALLRLNGIQQENVNDKKG